MVVNLFHEGINLKELSRISLKRIYETTNLNQKASRNDNQNYLPRLSQ